MALLASLARFNAAHPWSHNDAYAGFVLRHARAVRRSGGEVAVDVGCGTGNLIARLARIFPVVVGLEPSPDSATFAAQRFAGTAVRVEERPFGDEPRQAYDLIVFVASLHHMSLSSALEEVRAALRPGGHLVIVGLARETADDALRSIISLVLNPFVGVIRHPARATSPPVHMQAPVTDPQDSFDEIFAVAREILPGIRMRRRLFWRYTASWVAPHDLAMGGRLPRA
jgi:SAM-dependent methyltransferase